MARGRYCLDLSSHPLELTLAKYIDIADAEEDKRINLIGKAVTESRKTVAFMTDDIPGKAERYIKKLTERFPELEIMDTFKGPVKGVVTIRCKPRDPNRN